MGATLLEVNGLKTYFHLEEGVLKAVDGVSFRIERGKVLGIIGESGCGKSVTARSILGLVARPGKIVGGEILFHRADGSVVDLARLDPQGDEIRDIRGKEISMIFQEPRRSLSPVHTIGEQITEALLLHRTQDHKEAREIAIDMLRRVGMSNPEVRFNSYPHQLSGGMCQRAMIAMALCCRPALLIADEPTTALDVTVQAQIIDLMLELKEQIGMAMLYITHDLGVISEVADEVAVMYLGRVVEYAKTERLFENPLHPYTIGLFNSLPAFSSAKGRLQAIPGNVPIPIDPPPACGFATRCSKAMAGVCDAAVPELVEVEEEHYVRCFLHHEERAVS